MSKEQFCKKHGLSEDQFSGKEKIGVSLYLSSLTSIPEGFNPTVGGYLDLSSLTSIPEGFNPTVGGSLDLRSLTSIPEGFNPTVGGYLDLSSLTSIPEGFNPTVGGDLYLRSLTSIPEGFNPTVGGDLDLRSLTSIPQGFNPTVGGDLYLSSLTSIPEGFNPTVGGDLDLRSLTSIPEGFNPTVGGYLYLSSQSKYIGAKVNRDFFWNKDGKRYAWIDGLFSEILSERDHTINGEPYRVMSSKRINRDENFYIVNKGDYYAHGEELKKAFEDLEFKIVAEKLKAEPITPETMVTVQHYRIITGACEMGCKQFVDQHKVTLPIKASELFSLLKKTNAYGFDRFRKLYQA